MKIEVRDIGTIGYAECWDEQRSLFGSLLEDKGRERGDAGCLLMCEHPHVYTLGKSGQENNLLVDEAFLKGIGASYFRTDRGGDITYHGYGQLVGYPVLDLERLGIGVKEYIHMLEESVINTLSLYGIEGHRLDGATGVWLEPHSSRARKICAIGVRVSRYVTMHGFALNVNTDLKYFSYINPCGFIDKGVTSIEAERGGKVDFGELKKRYAGCFSEIFLQHNT